MKDIKKQIEAETERFIKSVRKFRQENSKHLKTKKSSLQILRDIRSGKNR